MNKKYIFALSLLLLGIPACSDFANPLSSESSEVLESGANQNESGANQNESGANQNESGANK
ncbi:MAG: hypothetical protein IID16_08905, partial [Candidatus Marinimicrobia bacterium]|nr:hypothetical protein [Candidatus Neomarinimicrobiota bacterium]